MNIFLTGANGYIGSSFLKKVSKTRNTIYAVTRKKNNKRIKNVKWLIGPIEKEWKELKKADILVHLAAEGGYDRFANFKNCYDFNVTRSTKLIINAFNSGCRKWLIISSKKEKKIKSLKFNSKSIKIFEKKPDYVYAFTKALFSKICMEYSKKNNIKCRIIRLYHVYGGNEKKTRLWPSLIKTAKQNKNFEMTTGNQKTDFNYIDDVVNGLTKALNFNYKRRAFPQSWDMGSGKNMSVRKFAEIIWKKLNPKNKISFSKIKVYDKESFNVKKGNHWKIKYTYPAKTIK